MHRRIVMKMVGIAIAPSRRKYRSRWAREKNSFIADQRGAVSFEMLFVFAFLMFSLLLPLADLAIAGFKFISAHQALRDMGQLTQFSPPSDVTSSSSIASWTSLLPSTVDGYPVTATVYCGNPGAPAPCASDPVGTTVAKYYTFTATFTLSPIVLGSVLCSACTVKYSQPFQ
jgi:hypothetical protein